MTGDIDGVRDTLIWAAGGPRRPALDSDLDTLLTAVTEHRLAGRMLRRLGTEGLAAPRPLTRALLDRHQSNTIRVHEQLRLFSRTRAAVRAARPGADVFPVKGFSLFALTGDHFHVRPSNKLDLIASDPAATVDACPAGEGAEWTVLGEEHACTYAVSPTTLVHVGFPVSTFPPHASAGAFDPGTHPGVLRLPHLYGRSLIEFDEVAAYPAEPVVPLDGPVSAPEMAALIRCVHSYVGYTMYPDLLPFATIFLDELCQVGELLRLETFDARAFARLVAKHDAGVSVAFVRRLWGELLGADPFAEVGALPAVPMDGSVWFPQDLWWDGINGFPAHLGWAPEELVARSAHRPDLVTLLGPERVRVRRGGAVTRSLDLAGDTRFLTYSTERTPAPVEVTCRVADDRIAVSLALPEIGPGLFGAMGLEGGNRRYELFHRPAEGRTEFTAYEWHALRPDLSGRAGNAVRRADRRHTLTIEVPWDGLGDPDPHDVRLVLRARRQREPWGEVVHSLIVPLVVTVVD